MVNKKPTVKYFHVFGAKCFTLKDDEQLGKFESKAHEGIFLGYSMESKAYRVHVIGQKKVIESMNVTFDDNKLPSIQVKDTTECKDPRIFVIMKQKMLKNSETNKEIRMEYECLFIREQNLKVILMILEIYKCMYKTSEFKEFQLENVTCFVF